LGYELNLSASSALFISSAKFSASLIQTFNDSGKGYYFGAGVGRIFIVPFGEPTKSFHLPVFLGYQEEKLFTDVGLELIYSRHDRPHILPVPVVRAGWRF